MTTLVTLFLEIEWNRLAQPYLALWLSHCWLWWLLSWAMYLGTRIIQFTKEKCVFSLKWRIILALQQWLAASIAVRKWNAWRHVHVTVHATHSISGQQIAVASYWSDVYVLQRYKRYYIGEAQWVQQNTSMESYHTDSAKVAMDETTRCWISTVHSRNFYEHKASRSCAAWGELCAWVCLVSRGRFLTLTMNGKLVICEEAFQVLTYVRPDDFSWINFAPGDVVPASAVVGGYWRDGTPLYVINVQNDVTWKPGFYNAATESIYVLIEKILTLHLLIENYWMKITMRNKNSRTCSPYHEMMHVMIRIQFVIVSLICRLTRIQIY